MHKDILFILYYVIVWSFVRQFLTIHVLRPIAMKFGLRKPAKLDRFGEQGYALIYFSFFGSLGIVSWCFQTGTPTPWLYYTLINSLIRNCLLLIACHVSITNMVVPNRAFLARISTLAHDTTHQTLLSHATCLLVPATHRSCTQA